MSRVAAQLRRASLAVMLGGAIVFGVHVGRPIDGRTNHAWRETDVGGIARNFSRDGMRLFYPQIDWRGDGPGYVESEFPLYPYLIAIGYRTVGFHEQIGRVISWILTLATLLVIMRLAAYLLPADVGLPGMVAAGLFFVAAPITNTLATAIQPEALMLAAYIGAVYAYVRWLDDDRWWWYGWALGLTALAVLAKLPAAHLGIVFVLLTLWRQGWTAFARPRLWILAIASLAPGVAWYVHARHFWELYGNSLGLSNHRHLIGLAPLTTVRYLREILAIEIPYAWTAAGLLTVVAGLALGPWLTAFGYGLLWYVGVLAYYVVIAGTSTQSWATYYHIVSIPPIALLFGTSVAAVWSRARALGPDARGWAGLVGVVLAGAGVVAERVRDNWGRALVGACVLAAIVGSGVVRLLGPRWRGGRRRLWVAAAAGVVGCIATWTLSSEARQTAREAHPTLYVTKYDAAQQLKPLIPPGVLIAVSSGNCMPRDESAGNMPWFLYWTDHRGFDLCSDSQSVSGLQHLAARGARYFIEDRDIAAQAPGFEAALRTQFPVVAETPVAILFALAPSGATAASR